MIDPDAPDIVEYLEAGINQAAASMAAELARLKRDNERLRAQVARYEEVR